MRRLALPALVLLLLVTIVFSLATWLEPRAAEWMGRRAHSDNLLTVLLGDGRRMFANHFFTQADVYFHSGYYPSIFDQSARPKDTAHMIETHDEPDGHDAHAEHNDHAKEDDHSGCAHCKALADKTAAERQHEEEMSFMGKPTDWIDRFGRHFYVTEHTHLSAGREREILPWLKLSASLDPQRIETYTVAAFWLRSTLGKPDEAKEFLREGLRANPDSVEILFELGRLYSENYQDPTRARNLWELALTKWSRQNPEPTNAPALFQYDQIVTRLSRLEEDQGHYRQAAEHLERIIALEASPNPEAIRRQIEELKEKATSAP